MVTAPVKKHRSKKHPADSVGVACFDFDGTLIRFDSFPLFLALIVGWPRLILLSLRLFCRFILKDRQKWSDPIWRSALKIDLIKAILKGKSVVYLKQNIIPRLKAKIRWHPDIVHILQDHKKQGNLIIVVSGGLQLYLKDLLEGLPIDAIMATELVADNGVLTGAIQGENCVRQIKPKRIQAYLEKIDQEDITIWAYGNSSSDIPMLELAQHRFWIRRGKIYPWKKIEN